MEGGLNSYKHTMGLLIGISFAPDAPVGVAVYLLGRNIKSEKEPERERCGECA